MDKIETLLRECPRLAEVIDLEFEVRRDVGWLNWGEVCTDDRCRWELICEVDRPDSCSGAYIEHPLWILPDRSKEELPT